MQRWPTTTQGSYRWAWGRGGLPLHRGPIGGPGAEVAYYILHRGPIGGPDEEVAIGVP